LAQKRPGKGFGGKYSMEKGADPSVLWWEVAQDKGASALISAARGIQQSQSGIVTRNIRCQQMYEGSTFVGSNRWAPQTIGGSGALSTMGAAKGGSRRGPQYNLVYELVSTVAAMILAPGSPLVTFLTNKGNFETKHKAQLLNQFIEGLFYQCGVPLEAMKVLRDSLVFGTGFLKVCTSGNDKNLSVEHRWPGFIWTEMYDGAEEDPRAMYEVSLCDKDQLIGRHRDDEEMQEKIRTATPMGATGFTADTYAARRIPYYEGWRLPSYEGANDGRHILAIGDDCCLIDEEWHDPFPFAELRYENRTEGFYGRGLSELLYGHQTTLARVEFAEAHAWSQFALPRLYMNIAAKINRNHANSSRSGAMLEGIGPAQDAIQVLNWSATHPNFVQFKEWIIESAHQFCGVSTFMSAGNKPAGLDSGAAQREYADIQQNRFSALSEKWGQFHVDLAQRCIEAGSRTWKNGFTLKVIGDSFVRELEWSKIRLPADEYTLKAYPVSSLPRTPSGRLAMVQELMQANLLSRDQGLKLLKFPDTDDILDRETAQEEYADWLVFKMLHEGEAMPVETTLDKGGVVDLQKCIDTVQKEAARAIVDGAPRERIDIMRNWLVRAADKQAAAMQAAAPPPAPPGMPGPGGGQPIAKGAPLPVSPMMPFQQPHAA
jgi:hypothetical protein